MSAEPVPEGRSLSDLWNLYDEAVPAVYGYLLRRVGDVARAEDLTAETMLSAVETCRRGAVEAVTVPWLMTIARRRLVDHWRRSDAEQRRDVRLESVTVPEEEPWDVRLDVLLAREVLATLGAHHRSALTLRYLDDLSVPEVAELLARTVHATEALLVRARLAFRRAYETAHGPTDEGEDR